MINVHVVKGKKKYRGDKTASPFHRVKRISHGGKIKKFFIKKCNFGVVMKEVMW